MCVTRSAGACTGNVIQPIVRTYNGYAAPPKARGRSSGGVTWIQEAPVYGRARGGRLRCGCTDRCSRRRRRGKSCWSRWRGWRCCLAEDDGRCIQGNRQECSKSQGDMNNRVQATNGRHIGYLPAKTVNMILVAKTTITR
jgi:hypothetical protein